MAWANSDRRERLPADWSRRRRIVAERAMGQCEATLDDGTRCSRQGTDCDHIARGDNHDLDNLQWLCAPHHRAKTALEAIAARTRPPRTRPAEPHPGLGVGGTPQAPSSRSRSA